MQPSFCLIQKLKRSSAENSRRPKTLAVELSLSSLSLLRAVALSLLAVALSLSPRRRRVVVVVTGSQPSLILVPDPDLAKVECLEPILFPCTVYSFMLELGLIRPCLRVRMIEHGC
ncbi:hypothetical protein DY000_02060429 [Brassica cretica]|uniref:Uncharacterized protein n=1 Tax=Brassica cretica TaxID=69181 RepID=A0ABQ7B1Y5_BRACR|nr:hypothetical protein DY000_02060429 [Brassica cretica]